MTYNRPQGSWKQCLCKNFGVNKVYYGIVIKRTDFWEEFLPMTSANGPAGVLANESRGQGFSPQFSSRFWNGSETGTNIYVLATKMASREKVFQDVFRNSNVKERKILLAKVLQFPAFNEEDDLRSATLVDVYYELLSFLVNDGFPWREVVLFFEIFQGLLNESKGKQWTLIDRHIRYTKI